MIIQAIPSFAVSCSRFRLLLMSRSAGAVSIAAPLTSIPVAMIEIDPIDSALFPFGPEQQQRPPPPPPSPPPPYLPRPI